MRKGDSNVTKKLFFIVAVGLVLWMASAGCASSEKTAGRETVSIRRSELLDKILLPWKMD